MDILEIKKQVVEAGKVLTNSGLIARTWGNISARISDTQFVITPSGRDYLSLTPDEIVTVNIADASWDGSIKPSSEKGMHAAIYRVHPDAGFIIHTHQSYATALSVAGKPIQDYSSKYSVVLGPTVPCAEYGLSGTKKLQENVRAAAESSPDSKAVLMKNHGAVCFGSAMDDTFQIAFTLEELAKEVYKARTKDSIEESSDASWKVLDTGAYDGIQEKVEAGAMVLCTSPAIMRAAKRGRTVLPYVDDMAQIAGPTVRCVKASAGSDKLEDKLKGRSAVLVRGQGALCFGPDLDEAEAVCMVLEKGCLAARYASKTKHAKPVNRVAALLEHVVYQRKYSKLKNK